MLFKQDGSIKPGYPVQETMTITTDKNTPFTISTEVTDIQKSQLDTALFEAPMDYRQVSTMAELRGVPPNAANGANYVQAYQQQAQPQQMQQPMPQPQQMKPPSAMATQQQALAQAQAMGHGAGQMPGMPGMGGNQPASQRIAVPEQLGAKQPGHIRIGVVTPDAQVGQGTNAGQDYGTPIRNAMIQLMSGPAVEVAALDSRIPIQIQAEAQQKECDYVLYSTVVVKKPAKGGFGSFLKMAAPIASMAPMAGGPCLGLRWWLQL